MTTPSILQDMRDTVLQGILEELITAVISSSAVQDEAGAVCVPATTRSSISILKEGVDHLCDTEFGLESLEADGPADSWLRNLSSSGVTTAAGERLLCKGPSWDRFVQHMKGQEVLAADTAMATLTSQHSAVAAAGLSTAMDRTSSSIPRAQGPEGASCSNSLTLRRQSSQQQGSRPSSRTGSGRVASHWALTGSSTAAGTEVNVTDVTIDVPLPPSGGISRSSSLQVALVPPSEAAAPKTPQVTAETAAALDAPVHTSSSRGSRAAQEVENAAWMASLRRGGVSSSNMASRRVSRSQSAAGASPNPPSRTISKLTHSKSARVSAPGHVTASAVTPPRISSNKPLTLATRDHGTPLSVLRNTSSKYSLRRSHPGTPTADVGALGVAVKAGSSPTSPLMSPCRPAAGGKVSVGSAGKVAGRRSGKQSVSCSGITPAPPAAGPQAVCNTTTSIKLHQSNSNSPRSDKPQQSNSTPKHSKAIIAARAAAQAAASAADELRIAGSLVSGPGADIPLPVGAQQEEELWAADTTVVQLFMDEYKEVIDAVDTAYDGSPPAAGRPHGQHAAPAEADTLAAPDPGTPAPSVTASEATAFVQDVTWKAELGIQQQLTEKEPITPVFAADDEGSTVLGLFSTLKVIGDAGGATVVQAVKAAGGSAVVQGAPSNDANAADVAVQQQVLEEPPAVPACGCRCTIM